MKDLAACLSMTRTRRIVLEPESDNQRLFNRILPFGYQKCFEFNFPQTFSFADDDSRQHRAVVMEQIAL